MSNSIVATQSGRACITELPSLDTLQPSDTLVTVRGDQVGLLPAKDVSTTSTVDLTPYATKSDLSSEKDERIAALQSVDAKITSVQEGMSSNTSSFFADIVGLSQPKSPVVCWLARRYDGGANIEATLQFPATFPRFSLPPLITGLGWIFSESDWRAGSYGSAQNLTITGGSIDGFSFRHTGLWPGYGKEFLLFRIEGFPL